MFTSCGKHSCLSAMRSTGDQFQATICVVPTVATCSVSHHVIGRKVLMYQTSDSRQRQRQTDTHTHTHTAQFQLTTSAISGNTLSSGAVVVVELAVLSTAAAVPPLPAPPPLLPWLLAGADGFSTGIHSSSLAWCCEPLDTGNCSRSVDAWAILSPGVSTGSCRAF